VLIADLPLQAAAETERLSIPQLVRELRARGQSAREAESITIS